MGVVFVYWHTKCAVCIYGGQKRVLDVFLSHSVYSFKVGSLHKQGLVFLARPEANKPQQSSFPPLLGPRIKGVSCFTGAGILTLVLMIVWQVLLTTEPPALSDTLFEFFPIY